MDGRFLVVLVLLDLGIWGGNFFLVCNGVRFGVIGIVFVLLLEFLIGGLIFKYVENVGIDSEFCKFIVFWLYCKGDMLEIFIGIGYFGGCESVGGMLLLFLFFIFIVIFY